MASLEEIIGFLDGELRTHEIPDYPGALNGLQLENSGRVKRVCAAVDASLSVVEAAAACPSTLLIVHHGLFWQGARPIKAGLYRKLKAAFDGDLAIYASHLPLDIHPEWGNNACLARRLGMTGVEPFFETKGVAAGLRGHWQGSREELADLLGKAVDGPVNVCPAGPERISKIGVVTGAAGSEVEKAAAAGIDAFITGEGPHWSFPLAEELGINVLLAGHYATETFGVKAVAAAVAERFGLDPEFVDRPTGL